MQESFYLMGDLNELENIIDSIKPDEYVPLFNDENICDFIETIQHLMDLYIEENPTAISEPDFNEIIIDEIREIIYIQFEEHMYLNMEAEDEIDDILDDSIELYFLTLCNSRYFENTNEENTKIKTIESYFKPNYDKNIIISDKLQYLRNLPQPTQRTQEWYDFRHNLITASNAYKAFESQSTVNQLIYEKCQPLKIINSNEEVDEDKIKLINTNTTLHWGQKYEPLSVMIYEYLNNTKVEDFGCIQHKTYKFIGASPDGINIDINSSRYGRMLEIKNIVNREITGIPKKEYWIQMQLQMEVCDLDDCDFLETKFIEYNTSQEFYDDLSKDNDNNIGENDSNYKFKGLIIYFHTKDTKPYYIYKPISINKTDETIKWEEEMVDLYTSKQHNMQFIKIIYWKLEKISCIYVQRNKKWFEDNIKQLEKVWNIILQERISGYEHRAPVKKIKKEILLKSNIDTNNQGCLLTLNSKKNSNIITINTEKLMDKIN